MDILGRYGFDRHHGQHLGYGAVAQDVVDRYNRNERQTERPADPAARAAGKPPETVGAFPVKAPRIGGIGLQQEFLRTDFFVVCHGDSFIDIERQPDARTGIGPVLFRKGILKILFS